MRASSKLLVAAAILLGCGGLVAAFLDTIVIAAATPRVAFDPAAAPAAPSYADPASWSALPTRADADDVEIPTLPAIDPSQAPVDVFYVHPTSYIGSAWNGGIDDPAVSDATDRGGTRIQATAFRGCCAVFAPRYRQANLTAITHPSADGARALALAGDDVIAAFRHYLAHDGRGRPFILAAHSQGAVHAFRLLTEVVAREGLRERLVAAYLIGSNLTEAALAAVPGIPVCERATQTGCVVAWNARSARYRGGLDFGAPPSASDTSHRVCVNPLTWRRDALPAERALHRGAVFFDGDAALPPQPGFTSAGCRDGILVVELAGAVPRDFMSRVLDFTLGAGNYHPIEVGLFFVDLRDNAADRVRAYLERSPG